MMANLRQFAWGCAATLFLLVPACMAQTVTGAITGEVTDPSGAVVAGAHVAANNLDTGVNSTATSDSAGVYRISYLPIGNYKVTINASGFGEKAIPVFHLEALQTVNFNVTLSPGNVRLR